jgi:hypothetical protein
MRSTMAAVEGYVVNSDIVGPAGDINKAIDEN